MITILKNHKLYVWLYDEKVVMNFYHTEGYGALMKKKLFLHVCSFSSPKGKHDIQHCSSREHTTCPCPSCSPDWQGGENHFTLPKTPLKIVLTPRFLIYGLPLGSIKATLSWPEIFPDSLLQFSLHISAYLIFNPLVKKKSLVCILYF